MKDIFWRILLSCALLPPGRIYLFYKGENAGRVAEYIKETCENQFVEETQKREEVPENEITEMKLLLSSGKDAFEAVEFEKAIRDIERALDIFRRNMVFIKDFKNIIQPIAILGICYLALGKNESALKTFKYLLSIRPDYKPSETVFPPSAMEMFLKAKKDIREFEFSFNTFPEGATVYIDGRKKGRTLYMEKKMPEGRHLINAFLPGYKEFSEVIEISKNENISVLLEKAEISVPENWWEMEAEELLDTCKGRCPSPSMFFYSYPESTSDIIGVFYSEEKASFSTMKISDENFPSSISHFISSIFEEKKQKFEEKKILLEVKEEKESSRWYLWAGLGVLVIGSGIGIYLGTRNQEKGFRFLITW